MMTLMEQADLTPMPASTCSNLQPGTLALLGLGGLGLVAARVTWGRPLARTDSGGRLRPPAAPREGCLGRGWVFQGEGSGMLPHY